MAWETSNRRTRLPAGWTSRTVPRIKARDRGQCQWPEAHGICGRTDVDVDHKQAGDDHRDSNLWTICKWHHGRKTQTEAAAARTTINERRPAEAHPGLAAGRS